MDSDRQNGVVNCVYCCCENPRFHGTTQFHIIVGQILCVPIATHVPLNLFSPQSTLFLNYQTLYQ